MHINAIINIREHGNDIPDFEKFIEEFKVKHIKGYNERLLAATAATIEDHTADNTATVELKESLNSLGLQLAKIEHFYTIPYILQNEEELKLFTSRSRLFIHEIFQRMIHSDDKEASKEDKALNRLFIEEFNEKYHKRTFRRLWWIRKPISIACGGLFAMIAYWLRGVKLILHMTSYVIRKIFDTVEWVLKLIGTGLACTVL
jgi:hypothetical protein